MAVDIKKMVCIENVSKKFTDEPVFRKVSMTVNEGEIAGITGEKRCGKTLLFKIICGFLPAETGTVTVDGKIVGKDVKMPSEIGCVIGEPDFLKQYSGYRNLKFLADLSGRANNWEICQAMSKVGLNPQNEKKVKEYTTGMRKRLGIAQAIMENQQILVLDEPMKGIEEEEASGLRKILMDLKLEGKTILISEKNKERIDILCDKMYRMEDGTLITVR